MDCQDSSPHPETLGTTQPDLKDIPTEPLDEPQPSEPLGSTPPSPKDTLEPPLGNNPHKEPTSELSNPLLVETQTPEEPHEIGLNLPDPELGFKLDPLEFPKLGPDIGLDPIPSALPTHSLNFKSCFVTPDPKASDLTEAELNMLYLPELEHFDFVIPDHLNFNPKYTNKYGREREFIAGDPELKENWNEKQSYCDAATDYTDDLWIPIIFNVEDPTCDTDTDYTEDNWIPTNFDVEDPPLLHKHYSLCMHNIESILEDQTRLTLDEVQVSYLVKYVNGDKGWHFEEELRLVVPDLLTHYKDNSPEKNSFPPGEDDAGARHGPRKKYKPRRTKGDLRPP